MTESNDDIAKETSISPASKPQPDEKWLTQAEAAGKLHIALDTMRRYVREGKFPRTHVGKRYLIPESAIEDFLQSGLITGPREVKHRPKPQGEHTEREHSREAERAKKGHGAKAHRGE